MILSWAPQLLHPWIRPKGDADHLSCRNQCSPVASRSETAEDLPGKLGIFDTFGGAVEAQKTQVGYGRKEIIIFSSPFVRIPTPNALTKIGRWKKTRANSTTSDSIPFNKQDSGRRAECFQNCFFCQVLEIWMIDKLLIMIAYIVK